jgi:transcription antitermination protein NusB
LKRNDHQRQIHARRAARRRAMQALYSWQLTRDDPLNILAEFRDDEEHAKVDAEYFREIFIGVTRRSREFDTRMEPALGGRPLPNWTRSSMRCSGWESGSCRNVPTCPTGW